MAKNGMANTNELGEFLSSDESDESFNKFQIVI